MSLEEELERLEESEKYRFYKLSREERERVLKILKSFLGERGEVVLAILYGSFLREHGFRDIDIALYIRGNIDPLNYKLALEEELEKALKLPIDIKILNEAPPWFIKKVIEEGEILLEKTPLIAEKLYLRALDEISLFMYKTRDQ
ncbi:MAG: nucleotidyltransferase domain-containing protein [Sulfolobales archaeon]